MHTRSGHWQIGATLLALMGVFLGWGQLAAAALAVAATLAFLQLAAWKPWAVRSRPLLWILYAGYFGLGAGMLVAAAHVSGLIVRDAWLSHVIGMAGFSVLIIGMVTRTALGHLGRPLRTDRSMVTSYVLVIVASGLRLVALADTPFALAALHVAALAWIAAFALYLWRFFPMMIQPRLP